ncbi:peptide/nickel transport system ATP-binding protein [Lampropedia hyalina DSM 16112]|jgi:peptide/nickel transport system ATP-binding protein|uniref:Peptide/nickel transport system ATP-binding protein n=1 Tax=Lampropedia hyalina DSM 16112 TaxID=1122156 RepID=A0A1M4SMN9_9BURK|nr:ABC transporter ATP-binding protein [Lampropedia hyalina]SHE33471.1 peptide/nickel transport system ATP-binding protein [Lampropedia hyalina DSM 16112]
MNTFGPTKSQEFLLAVRELNVRFASGAVAVERLDFDLHAGQTLALVGESGCGKSSTAFALLGLLPTSARQEGSILFEGQELTGLKEHQWQGLRGRRIGMVFQEPMTSLNPVYRIGEQIVETLRCHLPLSRAAARARALELLDMVRLPEPQRIIDAYPHEISGGQRQRAMIAIAISCGPGLLVADEATTALDATIQAQILELLDSLRRELNMGLLLITHDLSLVAQWADQVVVMHHGEKLEQLPASQLFTHALHPYTRGLIGASLRLDSRRHYRHGSLPEIRVSTDAKGDYQYAVQTPATLPDMGPDTSEAVPLLQVQDLSVDYRLHQGSKRAVDGVSLDLAQGETLGLVGESGCGKSTLAKAILRLQPAAAGRIVLAGQDVTHLEGQALRRQRSRMQMIFQDPYSSLNPRRSVEAILDTALLVQGVASPQRHQRILEIMDRVGLPRSALSRYAHEFSGGQRQRIGIARALIVQPSLVVCDEPVSALDVSVQAQILNLLVELKHSLQLSLLFISHDLAVVQYISDRVAVMQGGCIVEMGDPMDLWRQPQHDYSRQLVASVDVVRKVA